MTSPVGGLQHTIRDGDDDGRDRGVATAGADGIGATSFSPLFSIPYRVAPTMALALLSVVTAGCFNPNHIGRPVEGENHVPIVDILPTPTLTPIAAAVSLDGVDACAPTEFNFISLDDSDGDILTVRWDLVFGGFGGEVRRELKSSPPLAPLDDGSYAANDSTDLSLDAAGLRRRLGADLDAQVGAGDDVFQLLELRVSDGGFVADSNGDPIAPPGARLVYRTWNVKLEPCVGGPI